MTVESVRSGVCVAAVWGMNERSVKAIAAPPAGPSRRRRMDGWHM